MSTLQNRIGSRAEILVPPHKFGEIGELIEKFHLQSKLLVTNWQEYVRSIYSKFMALFNMYIFI